MTRKRDVKILKRFTLESEAELLDLDIIAFDRVHGSQMVNWIKTISSLLIAAKTTVTEIEHDLSRYQTRLDFGQWGHGYGHEPIARLYHNMFFHLFKGELWWHDCPDFSGWFEVRGVGRVHFWGDIGRVGPQSFLDALGWMNNNGDLWITLWNDRKQTILEPTIIGGMGPFIHECIGAWLTGDD